MAATASSNLARLRVIKESTFGTTPTTGTSTDLRFTGESLNFAITTEESGEIRSDRLTADLIQTGAETSGDVQFELSYGSFDDLMEACLGGTWTANELTTGPTVRSFSIEQGFTDVNQYILYKGMAVNSMSLEFAIDALLTGSFGFIGREAVRATTSGVPVAGASSTTEVMNSATNFANLTVAGQTYPCGISSISLNVEGGLRAQKGLGNLGACAILPGKFNITGDMSIYFADGVIYDKYIKNEAFALTWSVEDATGNKYEFTLPHVKISEGSVNAEGGDSDVALNISFQALVDPTSKEAINIKRTTSVGP